MTSARAVDLDGNVHVLTNADMGYTYRHCGIQDGWIVTEATVRSHVSNILSKLHLANRVQATLYALQEGLASLDSGPESRGAGDP